MRVLPGQYFDSETGTHYNYFRDYDPRIGRYVQSDPVGLRGGRNTFAYVQGNPLRLIDQYGLYPGQRFPSPDAAARDAAEFYCRMPNFYDWEYGGWIRKVPGDCGGDSFTYDWPVTSKSPRFIDIGDKPDNAVSDYHSHPGWARMRPNAENPSRDDRRGWGDAGHPGYLITPRCKVKGPYF